MRRVGVTDIRWSGDHYVASLAQRRATGRAVLLIATGVIDDLPGIPGLDECYGRSVFHCPYCDGWEWRDRRIAAFGDGAGRRRAGARR